MSRVRAFLSAVGIVVFAAASTADKSTPRQTILMREIWLVLGGASSRVDTVPGVGVAGVAAAAAAAPALAAAARR